MNDRELDTLVAEKVMGWTLYDEETHTFLTPAGGISMGRFSTDIQAAWDVVEKMASKGFDFESRSMDSCHPDPDRHAAKFRARLDAGWDEYGPSMPKAICIAALKALDIAV